MIVLLGPPGAGKGTQAERIQARFKVPHISTGDLFRAALKEETELGRTAKRYLDAGRLVPDEVTIAMLSGRIDKADCNDGAMLDGFPRTFGQVAALDDLLQKRNKQLDAVLYFDVTGDTVVERLSGRRMCKGCGAGYHIKYMPPSTPDRCDRCGEELYRRADDMPETIRERLKVYAEETRALVEEYDHRGLLKRIDANGAPGEVESAVMTILTSLTAGG